MTTGHIFIATSLDGFIARRDGSIDWLSAFQGEGDNGYADFMSRMDGIVMGRGTYETVLGFGDWPYEKPVVVMSRSLVQGDIPQDLAGRVLISAEAPRDLMKRLSAEGWQRAYVDGGKLIQAFLREGLISEMTIFRMPVLIGEGRPLFGAVEADIRIETLGAEVLPTGAVRTDYRVAAAPR